MFIPARTQAVDRPGHQLLARAAFAQHQRARVGCGNRPDELPQFVDFGRFADNLVQAENFPGA